jgi:hypothetical protein
VRVKGSPGICGNFQTPDGTNPATIYHSHPDNPNGLTEQFSYRGCNGGQECDIGSANIFGLASFLGTPSGRVDFYDPAQGGTLPLECVLVGSSFWGYVQLGVLAQVPACW